MYELTIHFGNVLLIITNKKIPVAASPNDAIINYFTADVVTANDYYPGGMLMPGRKYQASATSKYRYSINGQEKSDELNDNLTSAKYWEYDSRIVRRWNLDPVIKPWESPYSVFGGNPILFVDPSGLDWYKGKSGYKWFDGNGEHKRYKHMETGTWSARNKRGFSYYFGNSKDGLIQSGNHDELAAVVVVGYRKKLDLEKSQTLDDKVSNVEEKIGTGNSLTNLASKEGSKAFKFTEGVDKALTVYDMGRGMHALVSNRNPSDGNFWAGIPVVGGVFGASGELLNEQEKDLVESGLKMGYKSSVALLAEGNSGAGRRSGLTSVWVAEDVLKSVLTQGYFDMSLYKVGTQVLTPTKDNWDNPTNINGVKFSYLLIFPKTRESKVTEFLTWKVQ